jgi:uncharacterized surface protein with fasciclin (FAS1) repeats
MYRRLGVAVSAMTKWRILPETTAPALSGGNTRMLKSVKSALVIGLGIVSLAAAPRAGAQTIVEIAAGNPNFSTLVAAVKAAGLVDALNGAGPITVFAPTNAAFAKIPEAKLKELLKPENKKQLVAILTYHVVPGKVTAADVLALKNGTKVATLEGGKVTVQSHPNVKVNQARVTKTDITASNGVIHVIDAVLIPPPGQAKKTQMSSAEVTSCAK